MQKPEPLPLSDHDRQRFDKHRIKRANQLPLLSGCSVGMIDEVCHVICSSPNEIDRLLDEQIDLKWYVWLILGTQSIAIWHGDEQIWQCEQVYPSTGDLDTEEDLESLLSIVFIPEEDSDMVATAERTTAAQDLTPLIDSTISDAEIDALIDKRLSDRIQERSRLRLEAWKNGNINNMGNSNESTNTATIEPPAVEATPEPAAEVKPATAKRKPTASKTGTKSTAAKGKSTASKTRTKKQPEAKTES